jgi:hypothetical protein
MGLVKARMPTERSRGAAVYKGRIYVAGGEHQDGHLLAAFRALEAYDPETNTWAELPMMPMPRHGLAGAIVGDRLHLASGDIQSAGITGLRVVTESHDAFEFTDSEQQPKAVSKSLSILLVVFSRKAHH